ncbi:MAG: hypothetical protein ACR2RV_28490 [Verrucomicrobiales bacterium]
MNTRLPIPDPAPTAKVSCSCDGIRKHAASGRRGLAAVAPAFLIAIAPKCPLCWAAYMSAFASLGISIEIPYQPWLLPLLTGLLAVNLIAMFLRARSRNRFGPFSLCLLGGAAITIGKFGIDSGAAIALGLACLIAGSLWSAALGRRHQRSPDLAPLQSQVGA